MKSGRRFIGVETRKHFFEVMPYFHLLVAHAKQGYLRIEHILQWHVSSQAGVTNRM